MTRVWVSAIVLAGGRSSRFGGDKLAAVIDGRPLLHHAIEAVAGVADEVIVVAAQAQPRDLPRSPVPLHLVHDDRPFAGPLAGLRTGATRATGATLLVVGGDMPSLVPDVLQLLIDAVVTGATAAALGAEDPATPPQPLPMALARAAAMPAMDTLLAADRRSLTALLAALDADIVAAGRWRTLDPEARTVQDVDRPEDLPRR